MLSVFLMKPRFMSLKKSIPQPDFDSFYDKFQSDPHSPIDLIQASPNNEDLNQQTLNNTFFDYLPPQFIPNTDELQSDIITQGRLNLFPLEDAARKQTPSKSIIQSAAQFFQKASIIAKNDKIKPFQSNSIDLLPPSDPNIPEFVFCGRSNVGKSSLLNTLTLTNYFPSAKTPGKTKKIHLFSLLNKCRLIDLPGYGFGRSSKTIVNDWNLMIGEYLSKRKTIKKVFILLDSRRGVLPIDLEFCDLLQEFQLPFQFVETKVDKKQNISNQILLNTLIFEDSSEFNFLDEQLIVSKIEQDGLDCIGQFHRRPLCNPYVPQVSSKSKLGIDSFRAVLYSEFADNEMVQNDEQIKNLAKSKYIPISKKNRWKTPSTRKRLIQVAKMSNRGRRGLTKNQILKRKSQKATRRFSIK